MKRLTLILILISTASCSYKPIVLGSKNTKNEKYCFTLSKSVSDNQSIYSMVPKEYQDKYDEKKLLIFKYKISDFLNISENCGLKRKNITGISTSYNMIGDTGKAAHEFTMEFEISSQHRGFEEFIATERSPYYSSLTHTKSKKQIRMSNLLMRVFDSLIDKIDNN